MIDIQSFLQRYGFQAAMGIGAFLSAVVVMCATPPRTAREWTIGMISTLVGSIAGGAAAIQHYQLQAWMGSSTGLMAMLGVVFACGLPAWALVRWIFTYIQRRQDKDIGQVIAEARDEVKNIV